MREKSRGRPVQEGRQKPREGGGIERRGASLFLGGGKSGCVFRSRLTYSRDRPGFHGRPKGVQRKGRRKVGEERGRVRRQRRSRFVSHDSLRRTREFCGEPNSGEPQNDAVKCGQSVGDAFFARYGEQNGGERGRKGGRDEGRRTRVRRSASRAGSLIVTPVCHGWLSRMTVALCACTCVRGRERGTRSVRTEDEDARRRWAARDIGLL